MKKFRKWLSRIIFDDRNSLRQKTTTGRDLESHSPESGRFTLTIFPAKGGTAIEHRSYSEKEDRFGNTLYIITDKDDLAVNLAKIITLHALQA